MDECLEKIRYPEVFYDLKHRLLWETLAAMHSEGEAIDVITVQNRLKKTDDLEKVGGIAFLASVPDKVPSAANLSFYLTIVVEKALLRKLLSISAEISAKVYSWEGDVDGLWDWAETAILGIRDRGTGKKPTHIRYEVDGIMQELAEVDGKTEHLVGLPTGFKDLDRLMGGLEPGLIIPSAYPRVGKTTFVTNICEHVALKLGLPVCIFTFEMSTTALVRRILASQARVNMKHARQGILNEQEINALRDAAQHLRKSNIHLISDCEPTESAIRLRARRMWQEHKIRLWAIDYIQLLSKGDKRRKDERRDEELSEIARSFKALAHETDCPVLAISSITDDGKLRGSRDIGYHADTIWQMSRGDKEKGSPCRPVTLKVSKQRNGEEGVVMLSFFEQFTRFESSARDVGEQAADSAML